MADDIETGRPRPKSYRLHDIEQEPVPRADGDTGAARPSSYRLSEIESGDHPATPHRGVLENKGGDEGVFTAPLKNVATATIKGLSHIPGVVGDMRELTHGVSDIVLGGGSGLVSGKGFTKGVEDWREARQSFDRKNPYSLDHIAPTGADISNPILERTGEYVPDTKVGRMSAAAIETALGSLAPFGARGMSNGLTAVPRMEALKEGARMMPTAGLAGAVGEGVGEEYGEGAGMAAGLLTPLAAHGVKVAGAGIGKRAAQKADEMLVKGGFDIKPSLESIPIVRGFAQGTRERIARDTIYGAARDKEALEAKVNNDAFDQGLEGSPKTLVQATGDLGLADVERQLRNTAQGDDNFKVRFNEIRMAQEEAQRKALTDLIEGAGTPQDLVTYIDGQYGAITQKYESIGQALQAQARRQIAALGPDADPEAIGAQLRKALADAKAAEKAEIGRLYKAIDPENKMTLSTRPVQDAIKQIRGEENIHTEYTPETARLLDELSDGMADIYKLNDMRGLDTLLTDRMAAERAAAPGGESLSLKTLGRLKGAVKDAINNAVEHKAAWERAAGIATEDGIEGRLRSLYEGTAASGDAGSSVGARSAAVGEDGGGPLGLRPEAGAARFDETRSGNIDRGPRLEEEAGSKIFYPAGNINVRHEVVDLNDLITSHDPFSFTANPNYPQELQPRNRNAKKAQAQVIQYEQGLNPEQLGKSAEANSGAPIVGKDNVVESGNGRTMAIHRNYEAGDPRGYRDWLVSQYPEAAGMKRPVLVARRLTEMTPGEREYYTHNVNSESGMKQGATELSGGDAKLMTPDVLEHLRPGDIDSAANRTFVQRFLDKLSVNDRAAFQDEDGLLSQDGVKRISAAITKAAYGDNAIIKRGFESTDDNIRGVTGALVDSSGPWAKMREMAKEGYIAPDHDITEEVTQAVRKIIRARDMGRPVNEIMKQIDAFGDDTSALVENLLIRNGKVLSRKQIAENLTKYAEEAMKNESGPGLFGDQISPSDILRTVGNKEPVAEPPPAGAGATFETGAKQAEPRVGPNVVEGASDRLREANARYGKYAQEFQQGAVGDVLKERGFKGQYNVMDSAVANKAIRAGDTGFQTARQFLTAARNDPGAVNAMREAVLNKFRAAIDGEGNMSLPKYQKIRRDFDGAIRALEEASPGFAKQIDSPGSTVRRIGMLEDARKAEAGAFDKSKSAPFRGLEKPEEIQNRVADILGSNKTKVADLRNWVQSLPDQAREGLQAATLELILRTKDKAGIDGSRVLAYAGIEKLLKNKGHLLEEILTKDQMNTLRAIERDYNLINRSVNLPKVMDGSGTPRDIAKMMADHGKNIENAGMSLVGWDILTNGGLNWNALRNIVGVRLLSQAHATGMNEISKMVNEALLNSNPAATKQLLKRVPPSQIRKQYDIVKNMISGARAAKTSEDTSSRVERRAGGRINRALSADQLIVGLERARNARKKRTEVILSKPDETVVRALNIADQHI